MVLGELLVGLTEEAMGQFKNGEYRGLDALNQEYGPVTMTPFQIIDALHLKFAQGYNPEYLAPLYGAAEGVRYAEPNGLIGDGDDITVSGSPRCHPSATRSSAAGRLSGRLHFPALLGIRG